MTNRKLLFISAIAIIFCETACDSDRGASYHQSEYDVKNRYQDHFDAISPIYVPSSVNPLRVSSELRGDDDNSSSVDYSQYKTFVNVQAAGVLQAKGFDIVSGTEMEPLLQQEKDRASDRDKINQDTADGHVEVDNEKLANGEFHLIINIHDEIRISQPNDESGSRKYRTNNSLCRGRYWSRQSFGFNYIRPAFSQNYFIPPPRYAPSTYPEQTPNDTSEATREHYVRINIAIVLTNCETGDQVISQSQPYDYTSKSVDFAIANAVNNITANIYRKNN
jgi:hypothetical protein